MQEPITSDNRSRDATALFNTSHMLYCKVRWAPPHFLPCSFRRACGRHADPRPPRLRCATLAARNHKSNGRPCLL